MSSQSMQTRSPINNEQLPLVMSVAVVVREPSTTWWCSIEIAKHISEYVDPSLRCSLGRAIQNDHVFLVQRLLQYSRALNRSAVQSSAVQEALEAAALRGCRKVIQWMVINEPELMGGARLMDMVAAGGHLNLLQWLHPHNLISSSDAMNHAATNGFLSVVQWLHESRPSTGCTTRAMDGAALHGHFQVVQWLHFNRIEGCTTDAMDNAASNGHLQILRFLHIHRVEGCSSRAIALAADRGHLESVKFLVTTYEHQREHAATVMASAACRGYTEIVQFLNQHINQETSMVVQDVTASAALRIFQERYREGS